MTLTPALIRAALPRDRLYTLCDGGGITPLLFVRPGELRGAEWDEIDFERAQWRIPAERMKMRTPHIVPLCRQALELLAKLHALTGDGRYLFPAYGKPDRIMSGTRLAAASPPWASRAAR
jgi:integrase